MSKTLSLVSVAILSISTLLADTSKTSQNPCACLEQGLSLKTAPNCYSPAYNAPACISVANSWDLNIFASFIYWHTSQDSMETAAISPSLTSPTSNSTHTTALPNFDYQPGLKLGLGLSTNHDDWTCWIEYTWLHQTIRHINRTIEGAPFTLSQWLYDNAGPGITALEVHSKWKMHLDSLDVAFSRPYYEGTQITITPYAGLRALWIRQHFYLTFPNPLNHTQFTLSKNKSHSWAFGPMLGTVGHWMLGLGFRFEGKAGASLLYTRYDHLRNYQQNTTTFTTASSRIFRPYNVLRPTTELGLGLAWGSYLDHQNYYFDLSARYDFNILWDQNAMVRFINILNGRSGTTGNLFLHGLTLSARLDF